MKIFKLCMCIVFCIVTSSAHALTFTLSNSNGGDGSVFGAYPDFTLYGSNNGSNGNAGPLAPIDNYTYYTAVFTQTQQLTFRWIYRSNDVLGARLDPAGYVINGKARQLSPLSAYPGYVGTGFSIISIKAGDTFGWYVHSLDSLDGRASLQVSIGTVPEPAAGAMLLVGMIFVLGALHRSRGHHGGSAALSE